MTGGPSCGHSTYYLRLACHIISQPRTVAPGTQGPCPCPRPATPTVCAAFLTQAPTHGPWPLLAHTHALADTLHIPPSIQVAGSLAGCISFYSQLSPCAVTPCSLCRWVSSCGTYSRRSLSLQIAASQNSIASPPQPSSLFPGPVVFDTTHVLQRAHLRIPLTNPHNPRQGFPLLPSTSTLGLSVHTIISLDIYHIKLPTSTTWTTPDSRQHCRGPALFLTLPSKPVAPAPGVSIDDDEYIRTETCPPTPGSGKPHE